MSILFSKTMQPKIPGQEFHALAPEKGGYFSGSANAGAGALLSFSRKRQVCIRILHHAFNPMVHMVLLALSIRHGFGGPIRTGRELP